MTAAGNDALRPADPAPAAYARAHEPKQPHVLPGDRYAAHEERFDEAVSRRIAFLQANL
jgi:hypothetical protein